MLRWVGTVDLAGNVAFGIDAVFWDVGIVFSGEGVAATEPTMDASDRSVLLVGCKLFEEPIIRFTAVIMVVAETLLSRGVVVV